MSILDYLNDIAISLYEDLSPLPSTNAEHNTILSSQMELFGLSILKMAGSVLVWNGYTSVLHDWLKDKDTMEPSIWFFVAQRILL